MAEKETIFLSLKGTADARHIHYIHLWLTEGNEFGKLAARGSCPGYPPLGLARRCPVRLHRVHETRPMTAPAPQPPPPQGFAGCGAVTCTLRAARVLGACRVLAEQRRAHLGLAQHPPTVAGALCARVDVPRLSFHKVLSSGGVANGGGAELWLLHHKVIWEMTENENTGNYSIAVSPALEEPGVVCSKGQRRSGRRGAPSALIKTTVRKQSMHRTEGDSRRAGFKKGGSSGSSLSTIMTEFNKGIQLPGEDTSCREENRAS